jgi:hypothetical protein
MERYRDLSRKSGVVAYEIGRWSITVKFKNGLNYVYSVRSAGASAIATMKHLASVGHNLSTFISRNKPAYERKFR